jgi:ribosomal protein S27AE
MREPQPLENWTGRSLSNAKYRAANREKIKAYLVKYYREHREEQVAARRVWYLGKRDAVISSVKSWISSHRKEHLGYTNRWRSGNPEKIAASRLLRRAVANDSVVRPIVCSSCGILCTPMAHHDDYSRPLEVRWLCARCHRALHTKINRVKRSSDAKRETDCKEKGDGL